MSVLDYALPQRPPQPREEERDPSERALPRRSSSPVIGSPPVRAVPIGTPPKQAAAPNFNQQVPYSQPHSWPSGCRFVPGGLTGGLCHFPPPRSCAQSPSTSERPCSSVIPLPTATGCPQTSSATYRYPLTPQSSLWGLNLGSPSSPDLPPSSVVTRVPLFCCFSPEFLHPGPPIPPQRLSCPHPPAASTAAWRSPGTNPPSLPPGPPMGRDPLKSCPS